MKKLIAFVLVLVCVLELVGCNTKSMNYIIENEPSVTGIVKEVHDDYIIVYSETADGYPNGSNWSISLNAENNDSYTDVVVGDEIVFYYDGMAMETDPLQVSTVYAITLKTPADRNNPAYILSELKADSEGLSLALGETVDPRLPETERAYADIEQAVNAEHYFAYNLKMMEWERVEREFTEYEEPRRCMVLQGTDWYLSACEDDELVWFSMGAESGWYHATADGQVQDVYRVLRLWYDEVEYNALERTLQVLDSGQDYLSAATEYIRWSDALHLQVTEGSKYCYTYIKFEVTADEVAQQETERLRERGQIGENEYCFGVKAVFVPENEEALMWGMAGNTVEYDGNDSKVPDGALQYWRCGIIAKEDGEWKLTHLGTAW